ncbi:MAG TPA: hypothetical protein VNU26_10230, partial [Mycobacteriales bacterium]|nr:hypothetical protein [Mycobacteriales bacterium]
MTPARSAATAVLVAAGVLLATGCSDARGPASPPASATTSRAPTADDRLTGRATAVTLDAAFLRALAALRVAPSATGTATLQDDVLLLPVTGGEIALPDPRSQSPRQVLGRVLHVGGTLVLTGPDDTVAALDDLELDPDQARVYGRVVVDGVVVAAVARPVNRSSAVGAREVVAEAGGDAGPRASLQPVARST